MATYTVKSVSDEVRSWQGKKGGPMLSYKILVEGPDAPTGQVELAQKKDTPAPTVGQVIEGTIENTDYGPKLKKEYGGGGGGGKYFKPKDPAEIRGMQRSHAQEMALRYLAITGFDVDPVNRMVALGQHLPQIIDWFDADVSAATENLDTKVERVAQTLSEGPKEKKPVEKPVPTLDEVQAAWSAYLDRSGEIGSLPRSEAKKKAELQMAALGITGQSSMSDDAKRELLEFFNGG